MKTTEKFVGITPSITLQPKLPGIRVVGTSRLRMWEPPAVFVVPRL